MSTFTDKALEFEPVAFWYLNQADVEDGMLDLSPTGADGIYRDGVVLGLASPIETDAASRSAGPLVGYYSAVDISGSAVDVREAFTWIGWGYNDGELWNKTILSRVNGTGGAGYCGIDISAGSHAHATISFASGDSYTLTSVSEIPVDSWAMVSVTRLANYMRLYVGRDLVAERDDLPTGPLAWSSYNESGWKVGFAVSGSGVNSGATGNIWQGTQTTAVLIYPTALNQETITEIFDAAFLNPPLSLRGDLHFNCTLEISDEPTPALFPFRPDWSSPIRETLSWLTDIRASRQDYEQRAAIRQRPRREMEFQTLLLDNTERRRFHAFMRANQKRAIYLPIWTDEALLTSAAAASATELDFESEFLDFNDDGKLALYDDQDNSEVVTIDTVGDSSTTLAGETTESWTTNTSAIPVVRALVDTEIKIVRLTDAIEEAPLTFRILAEDVPLAPHRLGNYTPAQTLDEIQVFDPFALGPSNWTEDGRGQITIRAVDPDATAGIFTRKAQDTASREITSYSFFLATREEIARFLAWWYGMKGRLNPIWVPTLQQDFAPISAASGQVTVRGNDYANFYQDQPNRRDLAFVYADDTMALRRVDGVTPGSNQETISFEGADANPLTDLVCLSFLKLCRLAEDSIDLIWYADDHVETTINFIDLLTVPD